MKRGISITKAQKKYYEKNCEKLRVKQKIYDAANKDKIRERQREYRRIRKEKKLAEAEAEAEIVNVQ